MATNNWKFSFLAAAAVGFSVSACGGGGYHPYYMQAPIDMAIGPPIFPEPDGGSPDLTQSMVVVDLCGDTMADPTCLDATFGPPKKPFSLAGGASGDPAEMDVSLQWDASGYLGLDGSTKMGSYAIMVSCLDGRGSPVDAEWDLVTWRADVPPNTTLTMTARAGNTNDLTDTSWGMWTQGAAASPVDLHVAVLKPNKAKTNHTLVNDSWLQVQFAFQTQDAKLTPKLKAFDIAYKCAGAQLAVDGGM